MGALKLRLIRNAPALRHFNADVLEDLSRSFQAHLDPGDEIVHLGESPPADTGKRWQKIDSTGAVVGQIKTYQNGVWS